MRGEIKERGGGDAGTSATTSDAEIARNPHQPEGWRRDGIYFFVAPPPRCTVTSRRRRFGNSTPSRSPQTSPYLWNEALTHGSVCSSLTPTPGVLRCSVRAAGFKRLSQKSAEPGFLCRGALTAHNKSLIKQGSWAHLSAPLRASIKIKRTFVTPSKACGQVQQYT